MGGHLSHLEVVQNTGILNATCGPDNGKIVDGYLGIPYAKPPCRFEKAEEAEVWKDVRDCYKYGPKPPQTGLGKLSDDPQANTVENACLTLNIFSPRWKSEQGDLRPVMVFIHGGGFQFGASPDYCHTTLSGSLPLKDVVLVTIGYRLGVLGFLTTGQDNCKGNYGLWDQVLALEWVQKHIQSFGGNPNNVTVFGQSAGGTSADFLALSPHSKHLFHKMIPMSGSAFCAWAMRTKENQVKVFEEFAEHLGYVKGKEDILEFYKSRSVDELTNIDKFQKSISGWLTFVPNFDGDFFPKPLDELRQEAGKKQIMTGACEYEGLTLAFLYSNGSSPSDVLKQHIELNIGEELFDDVCAIRKHIFDHYMDRVDVSDENAVKKRVVEFVGDHLFDVGVISSAQNAAKHGNDVYLYSFEHCNPDNYGMFQQFFPFFTSTHCSDIRYVLGDGVLNKFEPSKDDLEMFETMTSLFANFAKTGNPGWEKLGTSNDAQKHYQITHSKSQMKNVFHEGRWEFMQKIVENDKARNKFVYGIGSTIE